MEKRLPPRRTACTAVRLLFMKSFLLDYCVDATLSREKFWCWTGLLLGEPWRVIVSSYVCYSWVTVC